jgi:hypothetical protein
MSNKEFYEHSIIEDKAGDVAQRLYLQKREGRGFSEVESVCHHEAAHGVVGIHFRHNPILIEIGDRGAITHFSEHTIGHRTKRASDAELVNIARQFYADGGGNPADLEDDWELELEAERLLRKLWPRVERLAAALYSRTIGGANAVMTGAEIERLFWTPERWEESYGIRFGEKCS